MDNYKTKELITRYLAGNCTNREKALIERWYQNNVTKTNAIDIDQPLEEKQLIWKNINNALGFKPLIKLQEQKNFPFRKWFAAASLLIVLSVVTYQLIWKPNKINQEFNEIKAANILPKGKTAILKLSDGRSIELQTAALGGLIKDDKLFVQKNADGLISYRKQISNAITKNIFHTLTTPNGGQFQVNLADGTKVWLNAASSLKYPVSFSGKERLVELSGEAYFEVAKNDSKPFKVISNTQVIEVLGTHFNINNYINQAETATTLLEGSIKISTPHKTKTLLPGQKALLSKDELILQDVDTELVIAWKNGVFNFENETLAGIATRLERWYNIPIKVNDEVALERFSGQISMYKDVSQVLKIFKLTKLVNVKFEFFGKNQQERRIVLYR